MPVQINEIIIRAIITTDDKNAAHGSQPADKKSGDGEEGHKKTEILELIDEVINNKKER